MDTRIQVHEVKRFNDGAPTWQIMEDYYTAVASDAELMGKHFKAKRYRKKAIKEFFKAGGIVIDV